jgi:hypothetical protein
MGAQEMQHATVSAEHPVQRPTVALIISYDGKLLGSLEALK